MASAALVAAPEAEVLAVAMDPRDATSFMDESGGADQPWFRLLWQHQPVPAGWQVLGYELVGDESGLDFHSWHCHDYADQALEQLGIGVNDLGLIAEYDDAARVLRWMLGLPTAEQPKPVPWTIVCLLRT